MNELKDFLKEQLQNPEVKKEYDGDYKIEGGKVTFDGDVYIRQ